MTRPGQPTLLDWRHHSHYRREAPCTLCGAPTPLRSHDGEPVHKTCAEDWNADHPSAVRFVSDTQPRSRQYADDHV
ncbi:hypothetical protein ABZ070_31980 [Streptomyces sp. NPDC006283]|uniref:hypothetical protein n=1 Tax=Streptomyces sp. NPDC006283 TaxID=3156741 RepID=UPI0033BE8E8F